MIVAYHPDAARIASLIAAVAGQVDHIYIADNTPTDIAAEALPHPTHLTVLKFGSNVGIGAAQNRGAEAALAKGASYLLLLDQDSVPADDMVLQLLELHKQLVHCGHHVAAVGARPVYGAVVDGFAVFRLLGYTTIAPQCNESFVWCDALQSSGTLMSSEAWRAIGPMNEDFFIDRVDTEWCVRASAAGWRVAGAAHALLNHRLGERQIRVWPWSRRMIAVHRPFRYYYMARNAILLMRMPHAGWRLRVAEVHRLLALAIFFLLHPSSGLASLRMLGRGVAAGLHGRTGPLLGEPS